MVPVPYRIISLEILEQMEALRSEKEMQNDEYECFKQRYFQLLQDFEEERKDLEKVIHALDDVQRGIEGESVSLEGKNGYCRRNSASKGKLRQNDIGVTSFKRFSEDNSIKGGATYEKNGHGCYKSDVEQSKTSVVMILQKVKELQNQKKGCKIDRPQVLREFHYESEAKACMDDILHNQAIKDRVFVENSFQQILIPTLQTNLLETMALSTEKDETRLFLQKEVSEDIGDGQVSLLKSEEAFLPETTEEDQFQRLFPDREDDQEDLLLEQKLASLGKKLEDEKVAMDELQQELISLTREKKQEVDRLRDDLDLERSDKYQLQQALSNRTQEWEQESSERDQLEQNLRKLTQKLTTHTQELDFERSVNQLQQTELENKSQVLVSLL